MLVRTHSLGAAIGLLIVAILLIVSTEAWPTLDGINGGKISLGQPYFTVDQHSHKRNKRQSLSFAQDKVALQKAFRNAAKFPLRNRLVELGMGEPVHDGLQGGRIGLGQGQGQAGNNYDPPLNRLHSATADQHDHLANERQSLSLVQDKVALQKTFRSAANFPRRNRLVELGKGEPVHDGLQDGRIGLGQGQAGNNYDPPLNRLHSATADQHGHLANKRQLPFMQDKVALRKAFRSAEENQFRNRLLELG